MTAAIYLDIETVPAQAPEVIGRIKLDLSIKHLEQKNALKAPANYKDPAKIAQWLDEAMAELAHRQAEEVDEAISKTSFDGTYGQIICVRWAADDGDIGGTYCQSLDLKDEAALLECLWADMRQLYSGTAHIKPVIVGHNITGFDLPFLWKRSVIHGLRPPLWWPKNPKPWSEAVFDTMTQWAGDRDRISMDRLCAALGLPGKGDGPTGADVWPMAQRGEFAAISDYCADDVRRTREIHKRLTFA